MAAVMMSQRLLVHGAAEHDEVADLARTIRTEQVREIRWMSERLSTWFGVIPAHPAERLSVAALRQRLGRSGRRKGAPAVLMMYEIGPRLDASSPPLDALRLLCR